MGDCYGTLGAAGMGWDTDAALRPVDSVNRASPLVAVKPGCPSQVDCLQRVQQTPNKKIKKVSWVEGVGCLF